MLQRQRGIREIVPTFGSVGREPSILPSSCNAANPPLVAPLWVAKGEAEGVARWGRALAY